MRGHAESSIVIQLVIKFHLWKLETYIFELYFKRNRRRGRPRYRCRRRLTTVLAALLCPLPLPGQLLNSCSTPGSPSHIDTFWMLTPLHFSNPTHLFILPAATSAARPSFLIPFALRTSGCNTTREQGSDSAPVQTIAFTIIDHRYTNTCSKVATIEELDVSSLGLQAALQKVESTVPEDSLLVTNGISSIRQVLHPLALRLSFTLSPLFYKFIDISRHEALAVDGNCSLEDELDLIRDRIHCLYGDIRYCFNSQIAELNEIMPNETEVFQRCRVVMYYSVDVILKSTAMLGVSEVSCDLE
uniref:Uncharacterized protein n=1 Tax=Setaria digitata TaxID=48799 RepID=A0A915PQR1_9BILA